MYIPYIHMGFINSIENILLTIHGNYNQMFKKKP